MGCCGDSDVGSGGPKQFDPNFHGPMKNRSCTDIICCLLYFVFILGFIVIGLFAWLNGDPIILLNPTDNQGRICNVNYGDLDLSGKPNVFFFDLTQCVNPASTLSFQCQTTQICVSTCPRNFWTYLTDLAIMTPVLAANPGNRAAASATAVQLGLNWNNFICTYGFNPETEFINGTDIETMISAGLCAPYTLPYTPVLGRCIPEVAKDAVSFASNVNNSVQLVNTAGQTLTGQSLDEGSAVVRAYLSAREIADKIFSDFSQSWYWLLVGFGIAAVVSFMWIVLLRWIAGIMVWVTLFSLIGLLSFGVWYCWDEYNNLKTVAGSDSSVLSVGFTTNLDTYLALQDTWLAFMIILAVLDLIIILMVLFLRKRIQIAVQIINQASKALGGMISTLFYPLVTFALVVVVIAFWAATALFLASSGGPIYQVVDNRGVQPSLTGQSCNITEWTNPSHMYYLNNSIKCIFTKYGGTSIFAQNIQWLQVINVFGMLWIVNWVLGLGQMVLAGAFASYYWAWDKSKDVPLTPLYSSFGRALRYHTGSLAFGALLIAIVQLIRIVLEYIDSKLKGKENRLAKILLCCCKCCFWCLEKFLKFINRNAYIMVAIYGKNFCWSAKEALSLLIRNVLRAFVLDKVADFLLFVGKLVVTVGVGALSWAFFTDKITTVSALVPPELNYYWMMIVVIAVGSYFIAAGFFNTFGMAIDTIFLCFLEDLERNDGSPEKPYFMSKGLRKVLGKKNKKPKAE